MSNAKPTIPIQPTAYWSEPQRHTLAALLELMIPASASGQMPSAATLGLFDDVSSLPDSVRAALAEGLDEADAAAHGRYGMGFAQMPAEQAMGLVDELRSQSAAFFGMLELHTLSRYYAHEKVLEALGIEATPPWPRGHDVDDGDWSLLDVVRQRDTLYR